MSRYDDLKKLYDLRDQGVLNEQEFEREKQRLLEEQSSSTPPPLSSQSPGEFRSSGRPWGMSVNAYCMLLHLSQFAAYVVPVLGIVLPIVMWAANKDEYREVDAHGRAVLNWILSACIYAFISFILVLVVIGIPMLFALGACAIIFPIVGAVRANDGELWSYPFAIPFFGSRR